MGYKMISNVQYRFRKMAISDNLKKLRKHRGLTQGVLAELAGVELTQISRIERGASEPKLETIKNLAKALNCSSDDLIMDDSKEQPYYVKRTIERIHELTPLRQFVLLDLIDAYCDKYYQAYISGNGGAMNTIAATVASMYNIDNAQAKALLAERCLCKGYELPIDEPTDDPISFDCSYVTQEWCIKFNQAFAFGKDSPNMQGTVIPFITYASGYGVTLTYDQAYGLLQKCCRDGNTGDNPCNDPNWVNLAMGGTIGQPNYNYGKNNYCDRCRAGNGSFPVSWNPNTGTWYYDQANGTDYCSCCEPSNQSGDYSCENVPEEFCIQFRNASAFGQPQTAIPNVVSTFTTYAAGIGFTLSYNQAYDILKRCCEQGSTRPTRPTSPTLPPLPTKPIQTQIKNNTNISSSTRGFDGEFMFGDY